MWSTLTSGRSAGYRSCVLTNLPCISRKSSTGEQEKQPREPGSHIVICDLALNSESFSVEAEMHHLCTGKRNTETHANQYVRRFSNSSFSVTNQSSQLTGLGARYPQLVRGAPIVRSIANIGARVSKGCLTSDDIQTSDDYAHRELLRNGFRKGRVVERFRERRVPGSRSV